MDAQKAFRIELCLDLADGFAHEVSCFADVKANVLAFSFDPVNLFGLEKECPPTGFDDHALKVALLGAQLFKQSQRPLADVAALVEQSRLRTLQGMVKSATVEGF